MTEYSPNKRRTMILRVVVLILVAVVALSLILTTLPAGLV